MRAAVCLVLLAVLLSACTDFAGATGPSAPAPAFDLAAVKAKFAADCKGNANVGEWFCGPVELDRMTGDGDILTVPTTIDPKAPKAAGDGTLICGWFANKHVGSKDLGYGVIGILDKDGGNLAACTVL